MNAEVIVGLEPMETFRVVLNYLAPGGIIVTSNRPIIPIEVNIGQSKYPSVDEMLTVMRMIAAKVIEFDMYELAEKAGAIISTNIIMLGALVATMKLPCTEENLKTAIIERWPRAKEVNLKAFELGKEASIKQITRA
jgi:indolepyruvate ferredoxin oxidoreductase beta subunit